MPPTRTVSQPVAEGNLGGSGRTGGNGAGAFRYLDASYGTSGEPETVYYSVVGRTNPDNPVAEGDLAWYAGASLFNGDQEVLFIGKPWNASFWGFDAQDGGCDALPESCGQGLFEINDVPRLIVVKMDFDGVGGATTSLWVEPTDCAEGTPDVVYEDANNPGFNRIRFQAGNGPAYMDFDEVPRGPHLERCGSQQWRQRLSRRHQWRRHCRLRRRPRALSAWGSSGGAADVDGDGTVAFGDVLAVLSAFGPC